MLHAFTRNHSDLSTDAGFQFEFYCDCCQNGFKSTFIQSSTYKKRKKTGLLGGLGNAAWMAGSNRVVELMGRAAMEGSSMLGERYSDKSPEWRREMEAAFDAAQEEVRPYFQKCPACNKWVCEDCWNVEEGLCTDCAPRESSYVAQARNRAMRKNIDEMADNAKVWHGSLETRTTICPECGQPAGSGKFCMHCGASLNMKRCANCGAVIANGMKFCGECGAPVSTKVFCPNCGAENAPGTKFCGECGTKL